MTGTLILSPVSQKGTLSIIHKTFTTRNSVQDVSYQFLQGYEIMAVSQGMQNKLHI